MLANATASETLALRIPAYRRARGILAGTISTFGLGLYRDRTRLEPLPWMAQPDPNRTLSWVLFRTVDDLLWYDSAYWLSSQLYAADDRPQTFQRIRPSRVTEIPDPADPDAVGTLLLDGQPVEAPRRLIRFDGGGLGGLRHAGATTLETALMLERAALNYAAAPVPSQTIKSSDGTYLELDEIDELVDNYIASRQRTGVGFLQSADLETNGFSARELQLVEGREFVSTTLAQLVGLPADAIDAPSGSSMTYSNRVDRRRELVEALRPWLSVIEQTLSSDVVTRRGQAIRFDVDPYVRDDPKTRSEIWASLISSGVLTPDEARALEPMAPSDADDSALATLSADELERHELDLHRGELLREAHRR